MFTASNFFRQSVAGPIQDPNHSSHCPHPVTVSLLTAPPNSGKGAACRRVQDRWRRSPRRPPACAADRRAGTLFFHSIVLPSGVPSARNRDLGLAESVRQRARPAAGPKHLAISAPDLSLQPGLQETHRHPRCLPRRGLVSSSGLIGSTPAPGRNRRNGIGTTARRQRSCLSTTGRHFDS
jgi:hypothetical protein